MALFSMISEDVKNVDGIRFMNGDFRFEPLGCCLISFYDIFVLISIVLGGQSCFRFHF